MGSICDLCGINIGSIWDLYGIYIYMGYIWHIMWVKMGKTHQSPKTGNCNHTGSMIICVETVVETKHVWNWVGIIRL